MGDYFRYLGMLTFHCIYRANDIAKEHKRSKVTTADVYQALNEVGFEQYTNELKDFMRNYDQKKKQEVKIKRGIQEVNPSATEEPTPSKRLKYDEEEKDE